jgi:hypothetical protein
MKEWRNFGHLTCWLRPGAACSFLVLFGEGSFFLLAYAERRQDRETRSLSSSRLVGERVSAVREDPVLEKCCVWRQPAGTADAQRNTMRG